MCAASWLVWGASRHSSVHPLIHVTLLFAKRAPTDVYRSLLDLDGLSSVFGNVQHLLSGQLSNFPKFAKMPD
jgi:hypothetical protein